MEFRIGGIALWCSMISMGSHGVGHIDWLSLDIVRSKRGWGATLLLLNLCFAIELRRYSAQLVELSDDSDAGIDTVLLPRCALGPFDVEIAKASLGRRERYCHVIGIQSGWIAGSAALTVVLVNYLADVSFAWSKRARSEQ